MWRCVKKETVGKGIDQRFLDEKGDQQSNVECVVCIGMNGIEQLPLCYYIT